MPLTGGRDRNFIRRNLIVDCGQFALRDRGTNVMLDNHMTPVDPGFADPAHGDFSLGEACPIFDRFGFRPIPFDQIGLYEDESRASWPVRHEVRGSRQADAAQQDQPHGPGDGSAEARGASPNLIQSISKVTLRRNRDGSGTTWFHPRVCMVPDVKRAGADRRVRTRSRRRPSGTAGRRL